MILDSHPWKKELIKHIKEFAAHSYKLKRYTESYGLKIESFFFVTCFIVRKISESNKLSDELEASAIEVKKYGNIKHFHSYMDRYEIEEHYDLNNPTKLNLNVKNLLNIGIHSFCFHFYLSNRDDINKLKYSIYINSDRIKNDLLYEISIKDYITFLKLVIKDNIVSAEVVYDEKLKEIKYKYKSNYHRIEIPKKIK